MTMKQTSLPPADPRFKSEPRTVVSQVSPCTPEERLQRIEALAQRIAGYVRLMCVVDTPGNTSAEAKERAMVAFYERMVVVERQLAKIQEEFLLA